MASDKRAIAQSAVRHDNSMRHGRRESGRKLIVGLSVKVRPLPQATLATINDVLREARLPLLQQPTNPPSMPVYDADLPGYQALHALRRLAAHLGEGRSLPSPGASIAGEDPVLERAYTDLYDRYSPPAHFAHLIQHSDHDGYYVPLAFPSVLFAPRTVGSALGSAVVLLAECTLLAAALDLPLDMDPTSQQVRAAVERTGDPRIRWERYGVESLVCLHLHRACRASIASGTPICFA